MAARLFLCSIAAALAASFAPSAFGGNVKSVTGRYGPGKYESYWAYMPAAKVTPTTAPRPAVVFVHGNQASPGLWFSSAKAVASAGGIGVSIDYDWQKRYPGPERETHAAIDAVRLQTAWKVDPNRIAVVGSSRGASVAVRMGFGPYSDHPLAVVGWSGVYDFGTTQTVAAKEAWMPCEFSACAAMWQEASPVYQVADARAIHLANGSRETVPLSQMTNMDDHAASYGLDHTIDVIQTSVHGIQLMGAEWPSTLAFLRRVLAF
jgi:acetyl esterase/lipase